MKETKKLYLILVMVLALALPAMVQAEKPLVAFEPAVFLNNLSGPDGLALTLDTDPSTPLYNPATGLPLLAPDGHHITLGEWTSYDVRATLKCVGQGTHFNMRAKGLVPYALYNIFIFARKNVGDRLDFGVLSSVTSSETVFTTNGQGNATVDAIIPAGPLSVQGTTPDCLVDNVEHSFILMYRLDGQTTGGQPGPASVRVNHIFLDLWQ